MSKALNELKKATMASYLSKAGGRIRSGTKIGLDFENDAYKDMRTVNKHHPNVYTPGVEKDPAKLAAAEKNMNVNFDLSKTFKRDAANRIKGIARAGRLLAKEETIEEAGKNPYGPGYKLIDKDGTELKVGHKFKFTSHHEGSKPEHHEITGWQSGAQRGNSSSSGRVAVKVGKGKNAYHTEYFPHVFDMKVVKEDVEEVTEASTVVKKAKANYDEKKKQLNYYDYKGEGGKKKKPTMGDLPDNVKLHGEEVEVPVVVETAQEKYRKIKEAKAKAACSCKGK